MADYKYIDLTGVIVADTAQIESQVITEYKNAFGSDLITTPDTPQGVLITSEALARSGVANGMAQLANQINPNISGGIFLRALCSLTGLVEKKARFSYVEMILTGVASTVIPPNSAVKSNYGDYFVSQNQITLDSLGEGSGTFVCTVSGEIIAPAGTITNIIDGVTGWETATNPDDAVPGSDTQSDESLRAKRNVTLSWQGRTVVEAITSALNNTLNVKSCKVIENFYSTIEVKEDVTMLPHSVYICVDGGSNEDVAAAIISRKTCGGNYTVGPAAIHITEQFTDINGVAYPIKWDRPDVIPVVAKATIKLNGYVTDPTDAVKQAIIDYANGLVNGQEGFVVGGSVSCFELSSAVNFQYPAIYVQNMQTSLASSISYSNAEIPIAVWQKASITRDSIEVVIL